ncbi:hypothetical protein AB833_19330 [Chromatiales bacterium (ex Bugula neritina AB1)]|nr:hypothetical protein AB833_19330 [Chromatiales bacterium (ex Bugula neritina AB1)]
MQQENSSTQKIRIVRLASAVSSALVLSACGGGGSEGGVNALLADPNSIQTSVSVRADLPRRITAIDDTLVVQGTVSGNTSTLAATGTAVYQGNYQLPFNVEHTVHLSIRRQSDNLLIATAQRTILASNSTVSVYFPEQSIDMNIDSDGDGFSNIIEIEDGSDPVGRNGDYDNDGRADSVDDDDDNDGVADTVDQFPYNANESVDTDLDGRGDNSDPDDDNDGVDDRDDRFPRDPTETTDTDGDGIGNNADTDDDNDGITDADDPAPLDANQNFDTDGDGISDQVDTDDDNDGVNDINDRFPLDDTESLDTDNDGIGNNSDADDDNDDTLDIADPQPLNANITGREDSDGDGHPDIDDDFPLDPSEFNDQDGDGIGNNADNDDDGNRIPDNQENSLVVIPRTNITPVMDGVFAWREWRGAVRCDNRGNWLSINHILQDDLGTAAGQWSWQHSDWRAVHDGTYLYLMVSVIKEPFYERFTDSTQPWHDDSIEVYFDTGNEKATRYDDNDYQMLFKFDGPLKGIRGSASVDRTSSYQVTSVRSDASTLNEATYEIRIDMNSIGLNIGQRFGFDIQVNDDDNGGDRDSKLAWFAPIGQDESWQNPSLFGQAILAPGASVD